MGRQTTNATKQTRSHAPKQQRDARLDAYTAPQREHIARTLCELARRESGVIQSHSALDDVTVEIAYVENAKECAQPHYRVRLAQEGKYLEGELYGAWCNAFCASYAMRNLTPQEFTRRAGDGGENANDAPQNKPVKLFAKRFYFVAEN